MKLMRFIPILLMFVGFSAIAQNNEKLFDKIEYNAQTRGAQFSIEVNDNKVVYKGSYGAKEVQLTKAQQKQLNELIKGLDLNLISSLKAPSKKRLHDGALHGEFAIKVGDKDYKSSGFDAGNAPKELKPLEDYLNTLIGGID
ncbi:hypothetical protein [uncultured Tenacibaculum sp.]|uniref:hypothetical protein n=1 Tax=uncultured Tenacibaculum sp. TaxID=174713 RepID=UPI00261A682F|nr:hypothetical protein [uncultured Tenacibaculum sp.]